MSSKSITAMHQGEDAARGLASRLTGFATDAEFDAFCIGLIKRGAGLRAEAKVKGSAATVDMTDPSTLEDIGSNISNRMLNMSRRLYEAAGDPLNAAAA